MNKKNEKNIAFQKQVAQKSYPPSQKKAKTSGDLFFFLEKNY